jgi:hypothetical protein
MREASVCAHLEAFLGKGNSPRESRQQLSAIFQSLLHLEYIVATGFHCTRHLLRLTMCSHRAALPTSRSTISSPSLSLSFCQRHRGTLHFHVAGHHFLLRHLQTRQ